MFKYFGQSLFSSFFQLLYVWASGFSAAFLKKNRVAARGVINANELDTNALVDSKAVGEPKPAVTKLCDSIDDSVNTWVERSVLITIQ